MASVGPIPAVGEPKQNRGGILAHEPPEFHSNTCIRMDTRVTILFSLSLSLSPTLLLIRAEQRQENARRKIAAGGHFRVCSAVPVSKLAISDDMSGSGGRIPGAINRSSPLLHPLLKDVCVPPAILLLGADFEPRSGKAEALRPWDSATALQGRSPQTWNSSFPARQSS